MKYALCLAFLLSLKVCLAATGNAKDGELMAYLIIAIVLIIPVTYYLVRYIKKQRNEARSKKDETNPDAG